MTLIENNFGKVRCKICDSVMIPDKEDVHINSDFEHYITCPVCGSNIWLDEGYNSNPVLLHILNGGIPHR